ncbi:MAG: MNIO family bufferin maturase [Beijerinckiaceae bacterium]
MTTPAIAAARFPPFAGLPAQPGIGLKPEHVTQILEDGAGLGFLEVHAENYMGAGGAPHHFLTRLRERFPLSIHGVGLSIGGETPLDSAHLDRLADLIGRYEPQSFSEHLAWSSHDQAYLNDLLPVSYDTPTLTRICDHIDQVQTRLARRMLLENPSTYIAFQSSTWDEVDFIAEIARRTGCGLLLDVNNVMVTCVNQGRDTTAYIDAFPVSSVGEIHLAGHAEDRDDQGERILIDAHDRPVASEVWALYQYALTRVGPMATLIEWDNDVPPLDVLMAEAARASHLLRAEHQRRNLR